MVTKNVPASTLVAAVRGVTGASRQPLDMKADQRPKRHGWAPGSYLNRCHDCKRRFIGDKRAILCAPCAYLRPDK